MNTSLRIARSTTTPAGQTPVWARMLTGLAVTAFFLGATATVSHGTTPHSRQAVVTSAGDAHDWNNTGSAPYPSS